MSGTEQQRAILASEFYWYGGQLGSPKVFDTGTSFNAPPTLRGGNWGDSEACGETARYARLEVRDGELIVEIDEA